MNRLRGPGVAIRDGVESLIATMTATLMALQQREAG